MRTSSPVTGGAESERRVEFDMAGHPSSRQGNPRNGALRDTFPAGPRIRRDQVKETKNERKEKESKDINEARRRDGKGAADNDVRDTERTDLNDKDRRTTRESRYVRKDYRRETRKGHPPADVLHGYKYPISQPKSILKRSEPLVQQHQAEGIIIMTGANNSSIRHAGCRVELFKGYHVFWLTAID
jgi:hypothetical protein